MLSSIKEEIARHWDNNVCDSNKAENIKALDELRPKTYPYLEKELRMSNLDGKIIIEIGVGSALEACTILRNSKPEMYVLYDISPKTLEFAKNHLFEHHVNKQWMIVEGDMENIVRFKQNYFDRVYALGSIHHTPDPVKAMKEIGRILKYGGEFLFMIYCKDSFRYKVRFRYSIMRKYTSAKNVDDIVRLLDGETNPLGKAYSKNEIKQFCFDAGLRIDKMRAYDGGFVLYVYGVKK